MTPIYDSGISINLNALKIIVLTLIVSLELFDQSIPSDLPITDISKSPKPQRANPFKKSRILKFVVIKAIKWHRNNLLDCLISVVRKVCFEEIIEFS